mmetsp:Transcript_123843/g.241139  ORF Transcript_123843/g.241139 Transcript_123843/m.241139 type:complete len:140 (-) Transcript_123843:142-561(-)
MPDCCFAGVVGCAAAVCSTNPKRSTFKEYFSEWHKGFRHVRSEDTQQQMQDQGFGLFSGGFARISTRMDDYISSNNERSMLKRQRNTDVGCFQVVTTSVYRFNTEVPVCFFGMCNDCWCSPAWSILYCMRLQRQQQRQQ